MLAKTLRSDLIGRRFTIECLFAGWRIRDQNVQAIEVSLRAAFVETDSTIPFDVLANYLAGAQLTLVQWWLEQRRPHTAETLAQSFHRLQRAAIRDAFGLSD